MTKKFILFLVFIFMILFAIICLPKETTTLENSSTQKSEDVIVVSNPKTPVHQMRIVFKEELTIGEVEGDENYMFGSGIVFNTDDEGNFYVADSDNHRIQKYDPEGKYLLTIGREGQGPGEFRSFSLPRFDKDNHLYIVDGSSRRISFFDKNGQYLRQIRLQDRYMNFNINSKGLIVAYKWQMAQEENAMRQILLYGLFDDKFNIIVEFFKDIIETPMPTGMDASSIAESLAKSYSSLAFKPQARIMLADNDFIYFGYPEKFEINIYSPEGKLAKKINRDYDSIPVSEKDKTSFTRMINEGLPAFFTEDIKKKVFKNIKYRKYKPAYQNFTLMENGWLAVIVESVEDEYTLFDIFDQEGKYIAHFKTPIPAEGILSEYLYFKNGKAYAVITEDEYWFVKRYNIELQEYKGDRWVKSHLKLTK
ncbi:MAG: 6-bladed beta-propeller [Candidatus Aminicenantes bacterium]|jgi:hypothetical protein